MTIKRLREAISNLPDDGEVYIERIEDKYFEDNGWPVLKIKGEMYHNAVQFNKELADGTYLEEYPQIDTRLMYSEEELNEMREQYIDTHCCINYDGKNLYITSHY